MHSHLVQFFVATEPFGNKNLEHNIDIWQVYVNIKGRRESSFTSGYTSIWPTIGSAEEKAMISLAHVPRFLREMFIENPNKDILHKWTIIYVSI